MAAIAIMLPGACSLLVEPGTSRHQFLFAPSLSKLGCIGNEGTGLAMRVDSCTRACVSLQSRVIVGVVN